jgi:hypothetical protein
VDVVSRIRLVVFQLALLAVVPGLAWSQSACDLNQDGVVNVVDVQLGTNMYLGIVPCTAAINGPGVCNTTVRDRVIAAATGGTCVVDHYVSLTWTASTTPNVTYNVYRRILPTDPWTKVNSAPITGTAYNDVPVQSGQSYYYAATAVSGSQESAYSTAIQVAVP